VTGQSRTRRGQSKHASRSRASRPWAAGALFAAIALAGGVSAALTPRQVVPYLAPGFVHERLADLRPTGGFSVGLAVHGDTVYFGDKHTGQIRIYREGELLPEPLIDFDVSYLNERGLLGIELHPGFPEKPYLFAFYSMSKVEGSDEADPPPSSIPGNRLVRLTLDGDSVTEVLELARYDASLRGFHQAGMLGFDASGYLWLSLGDGLRHSATPPAPLDLRSPLGKMLRFDVDNPQPPLAYGIPPDNPFVAAEDPDTLREIYSYGHRNHFNFTFHPLHGTVYSTENGNVIEDEINVIVKGGNYGWPRVEGPADTEAELEYAAQEPDYRDPVWSSGDGTVCPVGLIVATGQLGLDRHLIWGECNSPQRLWAVPLSGENDTVLGSEPMLLLSGQGRPLDLAWAPDGSLLLTDQHGLSRISLEAPPVPAVEGAGLLFISVLLAAASGLRGKGRP
jgi:glucose/arabinose dehydrogenase